MASTNRAGKRKRNCIETYNDLNEAELIINKDDEENSGHEEQEEGWVSKNVFVVQVLFQHNKQRITEKLDLNAVELVKVFLFLNTEQSLPG